MKIRFDLTPIGDGSQFADPERGDIVYIPFCIELDGQCYPAEDWEDYAVVNLLQWAEMLLSGIPLAEQRFEFMDDAWELLWENSGQAGLGTLRMEHSGLEVVLFEHGAMHLATFVQALQEALHQMRDGLAKWLLPDQVEPANLIQKLDAALAGLQGWASNLR
jgi:hypothetical protein